MEDTTRCASGQLPILGKRALGEFPYATGAEPLKASSALCPELVEGRALRQAQRALWRLFPWTSASV
jgi:hypothetical protein